MSPDVPDALDGPVSWHRPILVALGVTALVALLGVALPGSIAGTAVGMTFFGATYWLILRGSVARVRASGLSLGGLLEPVPLEPPRLARAAVRALGWAAATGVVFFPAYAFAHHLFLDTARAFAFDLGPAPWDLLLHHLLAVGLPEEMFYRGYLQTSLDRVWPKQWRLLGASVGLGLVVSSAVFAIGHLATTPHLARLSVFFPSLVFGWLRARTGGVGAGVLFHAACNVLSAGLAGGAH